MKKVCLFQFPRMDNFHGYSIDCLDPVPYFVHRDSWWRRALVLRRLYHVKVIDQMYRDKDPLYMKFLRDFVQRFKDADLLVLATYNPIHPEVLYNDLPGPIKVLGFVDDPFSTYIRGIPYLWAFDGAFYSSPSYNDRLLFKHALERWGCQQSYWFPLAPDFRITVPEQASLGPLAPRAEALKRGDVFFRFRK